ncbi:MAG: type II toxin-antitoxin system VapC family toxin [Candidatus Bathyarchaeia archaeon]
MDKGREAERPRVVIDASVAAKWIIPGEPWEAEARGLMEKIASGEVEAYAPPLLPYEVASVISRAISRGVINLSEGAEALKALGQLGLKITAIGWDDQAEILEIATTSKLTIYDSAYLQLSKRVAAKLITADDELKSRGENITEIVLLRDFTTKR